MGGEMRDERGMIGRLGEEYALGYFKKEGYEVVRRNWRCKAGEIDLILKDRGELVFVEVKTRLGSKQAEKYLFENITYQKRKRIRLMAEIFVSSFCRRGLREPSRRIDVVGVLLDSASMKLSAIKHLKAAF